MNFKIKRKSREANETLQKDVDCLKDSVSEILTRLDKVEKNYPKSINKTKKND